MNLRGSLNRIRNNVIQLQNISLTTDDRRISVHIVSMNCFSRVYMKALGKFT